MSNSVKRAGEKIIKEIVAEISLLGYYEIEDGKRVYLTEQEPKDWEAQNEVSS
jgi:hypothetical protein